MSLMSTNELFANDWLDAKALFPDMPAPNQLFPGNQCDRIRNEVIIEAVVAYAYGLELSDFAHIFSQCGLDLDGLSVGEDLDVRGFWRVDAKSSPYSRRTIWAVKAYEDLLKLISELGPGAALSEFIGVGNHGWNSYPDEVWKPSKEIAESLGLPSSFSAEFVEINSYTPPNFFGTWEDVEFVSRKLNQLR